MPRLTLTPIAYPPKRLTQWTNADYSFLEESEASQAIKKVLITKAHTRFIGRGRQGDRRFFGEAFVASVIPHDAGWYSSFKWLTADCWLEEQTRSEFRSDFASALAKHITRPVLEEMRKKATRLEREMDGRLPVPPDLWLIEGRRHRFIEAKLPKDRLSDRQLAGFAILATSLHGRRPTSLEVANLYETGTEPNLNTWAAERERFDSFCKMLTSRRR